MSRMLIFGLGYTAAHIADALRARGWHVVGTSRDGRDGTIRFEDRDAVERELAAATHILSSVPPAEADAAGRAECAWQRDRLPAEIRALVLTDQQRRNAICWSVFDA